MTRTPLPPAAKGCGPYINSQMAKVQAVKAGYDEAILLSPQGYVSECTGGKPFLWFAMEHRHAPIQRGGT
ncbi:MAG: hypothetical protein CM1200mP26_22990 [Acidimicrobiales bacterium]|nr:MAG: hypothetical protein CM1200mP26_22990 [Acidimicrobiales bacterium]